MAFYRIFHMCFILFGACHGGKELHCKENDCSESPSKYKEPFEAQSSVEGTPYMISPEDFYYKFVAKHRPIVMRKTASNWPANKMWTEEYLIEAISDSTQLAGEIKDFPFGSKLHLKMKEFLSRSQQEDLTLWDQPTNQMLNDITAPLCLRCPQFMKEMQVFYWLRRYKSKTSTSLFFHPHEQMIAVVNGSAQVTLVSPLYSEKLPDDEKQLLVISTSKEEILSKLSSEGISPMSVDLHNGDMLYIPQMWWQHVTLLGDHNLFVQFLWPSRRMQISSHIQPSFKTRDNQLPNMQGSLKSLLRKYEERFLTMDVPPLVCPQQDLRMSNYTFETGKMNEEEYAIVHNGPDFTESEPCNFDGLNKQSPCHFSTCYGDPESSECIRYILEYCNQWEDRGCVIELPQLLNKVDMYKMKEITNMESPYH